MSEDEALFLRSQLTIHRQLNPNYRESASGLSQMLAAPSLKSSDGDLSDSDKCWERPGNVVAKRNARERTRVHTVNQAFHLLKNHLPTLRSHTKRVSKLKILRATINYINALLDLLKTADRESALSTARMITAPNHNIPALADRPLGGSSQLPYVQSLIDYQQYIYPPQQQPLINPFLLPSNHN